MGRSVMDGTPESSQIVYLEHRVKMLEAEKEQLREVLVELTDLVQGMIDGDYEADSFTLQPAREILAREE